MVTWKMTWRDKDEGRKLESKGSEEVEKERKGQKGRNRAFSLFHCWEQ